MCTPIGHTLLGLAVYDLQNPNAWIRHWPLACIVLIAANLPDIDFLFGWAAGNPNQYHQGWTHSLVFVAAALFPLWWVSRPLFARYDLSGFRILTMVMLSHLLLDLLNHDMRPPVGIPLFWPFSDVLVKSPIVIFPAVHKASDSGMFLRSLFTLHNLKVAGVEAGMIAGAYLLVKGFGRRT